MDNKTANYLRLLEKQNAAIAAFDAQRHEEIEPDPIRLQREKERREKWGELRAREHPSRRPYRIHNVFGHTDLS